MARILIIDDEKEVCEEFCNFLEEESHEVHFTTNPKVAFLKIRETAYDLVFLDMIMPRMEGPKVFEAIRKFSQVPIAMMSGYMIPAKEKKVTELGAVACLHKPLNIQIIKNLVKTITHRKQSQIESYA